MSQSPSTCHMPMARAMAAARNELGKVFAHLEKSAGEPEYATAGAGTDESTRREKALALEGVSCTVCHRIDGANFGDPASFDGGFRIVTAPANSEAPVFGPFEVDDGRRRIMRSASGFTPETGLHIQESELCATCHTLFTQPLSGAPGVLFPEQVPYLEWQQSSYPGERSCQDCHMPAAAPAPIASVLGETREGLSQHAFRGGNAFMLRLLDRYRDELAVTAPSAELQRSAATTEARLQTGTARLALARVDDGSGDLLVEVRVTNLAGHKLPTAYPSRRAWLHFTVRDANGATLFESGAMRPDGAIAGNDNDGDPLAFEPHYREIESPDQVQIYEPIIADGDGAVTTGLLRAVRYVKDNRLLPDGFDKSAAREAIRVQGNAAEDADFTAGGDIVRYRVSLDSGMGEVLVTARLLFQTIAFRWAHNLKEYDSLETDRFTGYYEANARNSAVSLAASELTVRER